jgi:hypothetical protein
MGKRLTVRELNRALLARQGLLDRLELPVRDAVEKIGALQAQYWPALPVSLWSRVAGFQEADLHAALNSGELVAGSLIRGTLHLVSAREHPAYSAVTISSGCTAWHRGKTEPGAEMEAVRRELLSYVDSEVRTVEESIEFVESRIADQPGVIEDDELELQRGFKWRPFRLSSEFIRAPVDGVWGSKTPAGFRAAPGALGDPMEVARALSEVVRCHLRAFGPASAEDVTTWLGVKPAAVRPVLESAELTVVEDENGRALYDLPEGPRPDAEVAAQPRFLPKFDSTLLAYSHRHRARILPEKYKDLVYLKRNLQILATFTVDGFVAGTWTAEVKRRVATLALQPFGAISKRDQRAVEAEGERLLRFSYPAATSYEVTLV